jgi:SWI/SNF-related matrix-associated actin-dependent regulator 1 of chromatin subfamily A
MAFNLNNLRSRTVLTSLENYEGKNPYIIKLKNQFLLNKKITLTDNQTKYIIDNIDKEPSIIKKVVEITPYLGEALQKEHTLEFLPSKIYIESILAETDTTYHVIVKFSTKSNLKMIWLPKTQVIDDPYFDEIKVDVDFEKYEKMDKFVLSDGTVGRKLFDHQKEGIEFLLSRKNCILAFDMGLGKSIVSTIAALESNAKKILVVCPASLKINWEREIQCFNPETSIVEGRKWKSNRFTIVNYDILKNFHSLRDETIPEDEFVFESKLVEENFDLVIIDEAHFLKNKDSIRGEIMSEVCVKFGNPNVWLLSGTPICNRPMDYFNLLKLVKSPIAENWMHYAKRYCNAKLAWTTVKGNKNKRKKRWVTNGSSNLEELNNKTKNILLRRLKHEVLDMPEKTIIPMYYDLTDKQRDEYNSLWEEYLVKRKKEGKRGNLDRDLVELILLRKFIAEQTIPKTIELAENAMEQDQKVIIFTAFTDELNELKEHFGKIAVCHNGKMTDKEKQKSVDQFQNNSEIKVFIGNITSAGVGITLTSANIVIFNSLEWIPGSLEQCEDRAYRIGQKNNVSVYYQLFNDTINTLMWRVLKQKREIINTILNGKEPDEEVLIDYLLNNELD